MSQNFLALQWVKEEINDTLRQAQNALENYVEAPEDASQLKFCVSYLHQVQGTLHMVEFYGAALFASEMEAVADALLHSKTTDQQEAQQRLMQAIIELPSYLEHIKMGRRDLPIVVLPLLNELRQVRAEKPLSEASFFSPNIIHNPELSGEQLTNLVSDEFLLWARKLRQMLQSATLQLLKDKTNAGAKEYLLRTFSHLQKNLGHTPQGIIWLPAQAFCEWLQQQATLPKEAPAILRQLDTLLKDLVEAPAEAINSKPPTELLRLMLFIVARTDVHGEAIHLVQKKYQLRNLLPSQQELTLLRDELAAPDKQTIKQVLAALIDELQGIKERLNPLLRGEGERHFALTHIGSGIQRIAQALDVLDLANVRDMLVEQQNHIAALQQQEQIADEELIDLAGALLYVEASLEAMHQDGNLAAQINQSVLDNALSAAIHEARNQLEQVKDSIIAFMANQWDREELAEIPSILATLKGVLTLINLPQLQPLFSHSQAYIARLQHQTTPPAWASIDALAEVFSGIDLYLENYLAQPEEDQPLLKRLEQTLSALMADHFQDPEPEDDEPVDFSRAENLPKIQIGEFKSSSDSEEEIFLAPDISAPLNLENQPDPADSNEDDLIDAEIIEVFIEEAEEVQAELAQAWPAYKANQDNRDALTTTRRAFHTLKGSGRMVQALIIGDLAWAIESLFNRLLDNSIGFSQAVAALVDESVALLPTLVEDFRLRRSSPDIQALVERAESLALGQSTTEENPLTATFQAEAETHLQALFDYIEHSKAEDYLNPIPETLQRALHTLKGSAAITGIGSVAQLAAALEKLIKELRLLQHPNSLAVVGLIERGWHLLTAALASHQQLDTAELAGAGELIEDTKQLYDQLISNQNEENQANPQALVEFMTQDMQALLNVEQWLHNHTPEHLQPLLQELSIAQHQAEQAGLLGIAELAVELLSLYQRLPQTDLLSSDAVQLLSAAHETLLNAFDMLASGQDIHIDTQLLQQLRHFTPTLVEEAVPEPDEAEGADDELTQIFLEEAIEISETVERLLAQWQQENLENLPVAQLQRELHTLKGGARMANLSAIADLCHELETLYENINDGRTAIRPELASLLNQAQDQLTQQLEQVGSGASLDSADDLIAALQNYLAQPNHTEAVPQAPEPVVVMPLEAKHKAAEADDSEREILEIFLEEAVDLLEELDNALHEWEQATDGKQGSDTVLRALHTLKGGARLAGLTQLGDLTHQFETQIEQQLQHDQPNSEFIQSAYQTHEQLQRLVAAVDGELQQQVAPAELPTFTLIPTQESQAATEPDAKAAAPEMVKVSAELLENLVGLAGETSISRGRLEQQIADFASSLEEMDVTLERLRDQLRRLDMETEAQVLFRQERHGPNYDDFDPLEMDRYSTIQQLSRALLESSSDLVDLRSTLVNKTRDTETILLQQSRMNSELQEGLMKTRMVPFQRIVPRLRRIVRQISQELDKQVDLHVFNADGEMDRAILERLISPLEHMVRNALDHGMESREQRQATGKPEVGSIDIAISRDGGDILIVLTDDGRGMNVPAIRNKAIERGLMQADSQLSDNEIMQFVLHAGFSTAENITQISGRGVGMDVVLSEIKQMGGSIDIQSEFGKGTNFVIRLPFTVSLNRALMVRMGDDLYAIPLNNIEGIVRIPGQQMQELYQKPRHQRLYQYANNQYHLDYLGNLLHSKQQPNFNSNGLPVPVLLTRGATPFALQVDQLLGSREIVVKTLGPQFAGVMGVSGGTILGDGSVVIILDLPALVRQQSTLESKQAAPEHHLSLEQPRIMVVDDSVTVRKVTSRLLERNGIEPITAKDGMDAMSLLNDIKPDLILLDIEMPRMDGFEVATQMRHDNRLKNVPIIMITSRTGDKHRERAQALGVSEYLGKPFNEDELLSLIRTYLKKQR